MTKGEKKSGSFIFHNTIFISQNELGGGQWWSQDAAE